MKYKTGLFFAIVLCLGALSGSARGELAFDRYHTPGEVEAAIAELAGHQDAEVTELVETAGNNKLLVLEIGPEIDRKKTVPGVIAVANMEGTVPLATEAALYLASRLLENPDQYRDRTWYIIPCGNPDALERFFAKPLFADSRNQEPYNDDMDTATDEDGVEDLNGDGIISMMRVEDPKGEWMKIPGEPRLMKKADPSKGETGRYNLYQEGLDNDEDGSYNEDGPGGTNPGINFPHGFNYWTAAGGTWPGSSREAGAILKFVYSHPEIGMAFTFGSSNFCLSPPRTDRKGGNDLKRLRVPERYGRRFGIDTSRTYTFAEAKAAIQDALGGIHITDSRLAGWLGLKAEANPMEEDMAFYKKFSEEYRQFLEERKIPIKRISPAEDKDGSFELLAYYHLGIPSFALDFWTPPLTGDKTEGEPEQKRHQETNNSRNNKQEDPQVAADLAFLNWVDSERGGEGFLEWEPYDHPTLGRVEIGGKVPFADNTPPSPSLNELLESQVPWALELASRMPKIAISDAQADSLGSGLYRIKVIVENSSSLPYPIAMGSRNGRILPVILELDDPEVEILEGKKRSQLFKVPGRGKAEASWLIKTDSPRTLTIKSLTMNAWSDQIELELGGAK